jgi:cell division protein FtsQ
MKKTLKIVAWSVSIVLIVAAVVFTRMYYERQACEQVVINIDYESEGTKSDVFLTYEDVRQFIIHRFDSIEGRPMGEVDIEQLELKTNEIPYVLSADAYKSVNGKVVLNIKQRRAIVLVIDKSGASYYIDETGGIIPKRTGFPADVLVCNGNVPVFSFYGKNENREYKDSIVANSILGDIYRIALAIDADAFLQKEIAQLYVNSKNEFEMIPLVGRHKIVFGSAKDINSKFDKLLVFYQKAKDYNAWGKYKTVNLKYKDQIVCTKK